MLLPVHVCEEHINADSSIMFGGLVMQTYWIFFACCVFNLRVEIRLIY